MTDEKDKAPDPKPVKAKEPVKKPVKAVKRPAINIPGLCK